MLGAWEGVGGGRGSELRIVYCKHRVRGVVCVMEFWQCCVVVWCGVV